MKLFILVMLFAVVLASCSRSIGPTLQLPPTSSSRTAPAASTTPVPTERLTPTIGSTAAPTSTRPAPTASPAAAGMSDYEVQILPLAGPAAGLQAEISGLAWFSDTLILLPQYPSRFGGGEGVLFGLPKSDILAYLDGQTQTPLEPVTIPLLAPGLDSKLPGYQGFEAIIFVENQAFLTIETRPGDRMMGYLVAGRMAPELSELRLNTAQLVPIPPQTGINNMAEEAIVVAGRRVVTLHEANGAQVNPEPQAHLFDLDLNSQDAIPFPNIEYRITDATEVDASGRFWAVNYFFPGDLALYSQEDPLVKKWGQPSSHAQSLIVERLVEFQFGEFGLQLTEQPPVYLKLGSQSENWEGLARLDDRGFLLATDTFPKTLLGFVPWP